MKPSSVSLDTSVLLRLLVAEPRELFQLASTFFQEQLQAHVTIHVSDLVLAEAYFALQASYRFSKAEALETLSDFAQSGHATISPSAAATLATPGLATAKPGFVDRLIHGASQSAGHTLVTFEKSAKKLPDTRVL